LTRPLKGHVALVTGAGRGIGRAHALLMAEQGARVVVCDVGFALDGSGGDTSLARSVVDEIRSSGGQAIDDTNDISTFAGGAKAVQAGVDAFGKVDIVINNAGLAAGATLEDITEEVLAKQFAVHVYGSVGTARAAWPMMKAQHWGRVINTVSEAAFPSKVTGGHGGGLGYGTAKAAVWAATFGMSSEGMPHGITVNAISPGAFTRMNEAMFKQIPTTLDLDPMYVARVAAWLASDDASDVTGKVIHAAGGQHREYIMARHADTDLMSRLNKVVVR
jgi:NAD(P)-dependent dehydrogenase (short-subunit alcohol dehydrogenase family)